jgi:hypothetical protein
MLPCHPRRLGCSAPSRQRAILVNSASLELSSWDRSATRACLHSIITLYGKKTSPSRAVIRPNLAPMAFRPLTDREPDPSGILRLGMQTLEDLEVRS